MSSSPLLARIAKTCLLDPLQIKRLSHSDLVQVLQEYTFGVLHRCCGSCSWTEDVCREQALECANVLVCGATGVGKTSLIDLLKRALESRSSGVLSTQSCGGEGTLHLDEHLDLSVRLFDSRGHFTFVDTEADEVRWICEGLILPGDFIPRESCAADKEAYEQMLKDIAGQDASRVRIGEKMHGVLIVVKADDPRLDKRYMHVYQQIRAIFNTVGIKPVVLMTHKDMVTTEELDVRIASAAALFGTTNGSVFPLTNYTSRDQPRSEADEMQAMRALATTVLRAEQNVMFRLSKLT